jgi:copper homeostasis protein CutC
MAQWVVAVHSQMNIHKNARLTLARRMELVNDIFEGGLAPYAAAARCCR